MPDDLPGPAPSEPGDDDLAALLAAGDAGLRRPSGDAPASDPDAVGVPRPLARAAAFSWRVLVVAALVVVGVLALARLRLVVLPVLMALFATAVLYPPVRWLRERGWPPLAATWAVIVAAALVVTGVMLVIVPSIVNEADTLYESLREGFADIRGWLVTGPLGLSEDQVSGFFDNLSEQLRTGGGSLASGALAGAALAVEVIAGILLAITLTFFFVKDGPRMSAWALSVFPRHRRTEVADLGQIAWRTLGPYLRGVALIGIVDAILIGVGLAIVGVPLVVPLAMLVFIGAFFPLVGSFTAGLVAAVVALASGGITDALLVVGISVVVQEIEGDVLAPLVLGRSVKLHPVAILVALTAGAVIGGIAGAFLAVPLAAILAAVVGYYRSGAVPPAEPVSEHADG